MGDEEDAVVALAVEGAQPGLSQPGGEDDETGLVAGLAGLMQRLQGLLLNGVRVGWCFECLLRYFGGHRTATACLGPADPLFGQRLRGWMLEEALEGIEDVAEAPGIATGDDAVVPLDSGEEADVREVGAAHEGDALGIARMEQVGLGMEALLAGFEGPQLNAIGMEHLGTYLKPGETIRSPASS